MNILVTGSDGFIGSHLCEVLERRGYTVDRWDLKRGKDAWDLTVNDTKDKLVIHLAGVSGAREKNKDFMTGNTLLSRRVFGISDKVIYASSSNAAHPNKNEYAWSKRQSELHAHENCIGLRFSNVYGSEPRENMLLGLIKSGKLEYVTRHIRDYIHIDDVCSAVLCVIKNFDNINDKWLDVSSGVGVRVDQLVKYITGIDYPVREPMNEVTNNLTIPNALMNWGWQPTKNILAEAKKS